ncbi:hypothetical protein [Mycobacterium sp. SMC-19]|uniref:hypothetical protein n=1 Tax=Mycobacterium sp. SMC-19 TaxID=3381630 RepID=UPI003876758A
MDPVTAAQLRRFVVERLAPAGATDAQLDRALDAVLEKAPLSTWSFDGHWYTTDAVRVVGAAADRGRCGGRLVIRYYA